MIPVKSNSTSYSGSTVSSNLVIWQGPCISCINLQTGDIISDVTNKLAIEICALKEQLDLSDLNLSCLFSACATFPDAISQCAIREMTVTLRARNAADSFNVYGTGSQIETATFGMFASGFTEPDGSSKAYTFQCDSAYRKRIRRLLYHFI